MPFLLAEILNFQGSTHRYGVGSFSNTLKLTTCIPFIQLSKFIFTAIKLTHPLASNNYTHKLLTYGSLL